MSIAPATIPRGIYILDPVRSSCGFAVRHNGVSTFRGHFDQFDARLVDGVLTGTAEVESIATGIPELLTALTSPVFFDVSKTPTVEFRSTDIRVATDDSVDVDGELTIRARPQPVTATGKVEVRLGLRGPAVGFDLSTVVDRRRFGLVWQAALPSGGEALGWDVTLDVHLELAAADA